MRAELDERREQAMRAALVDGKVEAASVVALPVVGMAAVTPSTVKLSVVLEVGATFAVSVVMSWMRGSAFAACDHDQGMPAQTRPITIPAAAMR